MIKHIYIRNKFKERNINLMTADDFKGVKLVLFDFDDTLAIHTKHYDEDDSVYFEDMLRGNSEWWTKRCEISEKMKNLLQICYISNIRVGLISAVSLPIIADMKIKWVEDHYGYKLENFCSSTAGEKLAIIETAMKAYNLKPNEICFIDDLYSTVIKVASKGVWAISCLEAVNLVDKINANRGL